MAGTQARAGLAAVPSRYYLTTEGRHFPISRRRSNRGVTPGVPRVRAGRGQLGDSLPWPRRGSLAGPARRRPVLACGAAVRARAPGRPEGGSSVAARAALVGGATGIAWLPRPGRRPAGGDGMPGEGGGAEVVGEVVTVGLAGSLVESEGVQRLAVVGELSQAAGAVDGAQDAGDPGGGVHGGARGGWHREPEAQAAAGAEDGAVCLLLRRVERVAGPVGQDGADPGQRARGDHRAVR